MDTWKLSVNLQGSIISTLVKKILNLDDKLDAREKRELRELAKVKNPNLRLNIDRGEEANYVQG